MPLTDDDQTCCNFRLTTQPHTPVQSYKQQGGVVHFFDVPSPHAELEIIAESHTETNRTNPYADLNLVTSDWDYYESRAADDIGTDYAEFLMPTNLVPAHAEAAHIAHSVREECGPSVASFVIAVTKQINATLTYEKGATDAYTTLDQFLKQRRGVCQDFAHLMLAVCRSQNIPARYVSGYTYGGGETGIRADRAMHAWVECLLPGGFWRGFDPTNNLLANHYYVKVYVGRDYADAAPVQGAYRGGASRSLYVNVQVQAEDPA